jgi:predicted HTH domain antitoxin
MTSALASQLEKMERFFFMLLYAPIDGSLFVPVQGETWLQKEMYALSRIFPDIEEDADFEAYHYGSFSESVDEVKDQYKNSKYVTRDPRGQLQLSAKGLELAEEVWRAATLEERRAIQEVKQAYNDMGRDELLLFMYGTYPETAENSDVRERIMANRRRLALNLYKKGKVSYQKAAELAGMRLDDFMQQVKILVNQ